MFQAIVNALFPVVFCSALGWFLARRTALLESPRLAELVTLIGLPALILNGVLNMTTPIWTVSDTLVAILMLLAVMAASGALVLKLSGLSVRGYLATLVNPNTGNLGIPLVFSLLGEQALIHALVISIVVQVSHFTFGVWLLSGGFTWKTLFRNVSILALLAGALWKVSGIETPEAVMTTLTMLSGMTIPVMLLLLGRSLASINFKERSRIGRILGLSMLRVALGVGGGLAVLAVWPLEPLVQQVFMLQAVMPVAVISYILASRYDGPNDDIAAVTLVSMPVSLIAVVGIMRWMS